MKHLKFLPFLIAAASYMPRAHAAEVAQSAEPSGVSMLLICFGLVLLSAAAPRHSAVVKPEQQ
ncbi:hypothetical protein [Duganella radicis]|uniref:Uncharacterized protein n=1 Tax=Duganella radicis TaxID=551988 RepID=A0A6L6PS75_9BURK|nr:hypothetical protein [Duganella radicis]MTV41918.1 hypothetical protein [Duganella radicis]